MMGLAHTSIYAANVTIPGADPNVSDTAYKQNMVDQKAIQGLEKESTEELQKISRGKTTPRGISKTVGRIRENIKATNFNSSIIILQDKDRAIKFTLPVNSITSLVAPLSDDYA